MRSVVATITTQGGLWYYKVDPLPISAGAPLAETLGEMNGIVTSHFADCEDGEDIAAAQDAMVDAADAMAQAEREQREADDIARLEEHGTTKAVDATKEA